MSLYSPEASYKGRRFKKQTLAVNFTRTHFYTYISVPLSLSSLIPVRRRSCCWSGDAPEADRLRQRRTRFRQRRYGQASKENLHSPLRLVEKFTRLLVRRPTKTEADKISLATLIPVRRRTCFWSGDPPEADKLRQRRTISDSIQETFYNINLIKNQSF